LCGSWWCQICGAWFKQSFLTIIYINLFMILSDLFYFRLRPCLVTIFKQFHWSILLTGSLRFLIRFYNRYISSRVVITRSRNNKSWFLVIIPFLLLSLLAHRTLITYLQLESRCEDGFFYLSMYTTWIFYRILNNVWNYPEPEAGPDFRKRGDQLHLLAQKGGWSKMWQIFLVFFNFVYKMDL
jgi:hypothetical protein